MLVNYETTWYSSNRAAYEIDGGGASFDFGCYGANLLTWFTDNQKQQSVIAVTQRLQPAFYPHSDDEATIIVSYPKAVAIITSVLELAVRAQRYGSLQPNEMRQHGGVGGPEVEVARRQLSGIQGRAHPRDRRRFTRSFLRRSAREDQTRRAFRAGKQSRRYANPARRKAVRSIGKNGHN